MLKSSLFYVQALLQNSQFSTSAPWQGKAGTEEQKSLIAFFFSCFDCLMLLVYLPLEYTSEKLIDPLRPALINPEKI